MFSIEVPPLRWVCKKIARKSMAMVSEYSGMLTLSREFSSEPRVRVLTYHRFGDCPYDPFCVSADYFEQQMAFLAEHNLAISLEEFEKYLKGELTLKKDAVLITVDDGFQSLNKIALPILKKYALSAVAFITPTLIQEKGVVISHSDGLLEPYMDWQEVSKLAENNVAIGSHAWTHRSLGMLSEESVMEEAVLSRQALEDRLSQPVTSFAYPFGTKADFSDKTAEIIKEAGYSCAFTSQHGAAIRHINPYDLPRVKVEGGEALWVFRSLVKGGLDAWRLIDQTLWRLQANRNV